MSEPKTTVEKLRFLACMKVGDQIPDWLGGPNDWGPPLAALCAAAVDEIEYLRGLAGAVSAGPSFNEIRKGQKNPPKGA